DDLVGKPQFRLPLAAQPAVELGMLLAEACFLGVDEVGVAVEGFEPQGVALLELLGEERLLEPQGEDDGVGVLLAVDLDLVFEGERFGAPAGYSYQHTEKSRAHGQKNELSHAAPPSGERRDSADPEAAASRGPGHVLRWTGKK